MKGGVVQINWHDTKPVLSLDFHPISRFLATAGADFDIKLWVINSGESTKEVATATYQNSLTYHGSTVNVLRFSPSGEQLASGADGGELIIWKSNSAETGQTWKVFKSLLFHRKDVLDLQWSNDGSFIISASVDNSCIIWDASKGSVHQILDSHAHYVQGVAWDPMGKYIASLSSDRSCRVYANKPQAKTKGSEKMSYACQHVIIKAEQHKLDDSKSAKYHLFHDETLPSFFRRLAWSPDGSFLLAPAGCYKLSPTITSVPVNTAYIFSRKDFSRPAIQLPGASKPVVAVRFCPLVFRLRGSSLDGLFKLPYRLIFAVATLNSLYIYDTECVTPIAVLAGLHYAAITDIAWSPDAKYIALSSQDGFCTLVEFDNDELGLAVPITEERKVNCYENKIPVFEMIDDDMVIEVMPGDGVSARDGPSGKSPDNKNPVIHILDDKIEEMAEDDVSQEREAKSDGTPAPRDYTSTSILNKPAKKRITPVAIKDGAAAKGPHNPVIDLVDDMAVEETPKVGDAATSSQKCRARRDGTPAPPDPFAGSASISNGPSKKRIAPVAIHPS